MTEKASDNNHKYFYFIQALGYIFMKDRGMKIDRGIDPVRESADQTRLSKNYLCQ